jgi:hypothetical protein
MWNGILLHALREGKWLLWWIDLLPLQGLQGSIEGLPELLTGISELVGQLAFAMFPYVERISSQVSLLSIERGSYR